MLLPSGRLKLTVGLTVGINCIIFMLLQKLQ